MDEYENYGPTIVRPLRKAEKLDAQLVGESENDEIQLQRNELYKSTLDLVTWTLEQIRTTGMGRPPDRLADERAASILVDWYEWSRQGRASGE